MLFIEEKHLLVAYNQTKNVECFMCISIYCSIIGLTRRKRIVKISLFVVGRDDVTKVLLI